MSVIDSIAALEAVVGKQPPAINLKVIDHVDATARRWLAASPLMFAGIGDGASIAITIGGGEPGFASADAATLSVPLDLIDDPALVRAGAGFSSLFLLPGIGETLRINGRVADTESGIARIAIEECYVHCAKALIRSDFWSAEPLVGAPDEVGAFVAASRFMALATVDPQGHADLSPKGDPAGCMARLADGALWFPDRPGNRRTDSFRNIIAQPRIAAALLLPGSSAIAILSGTASPTSDEAARLPFAVQGKTPLLVTTVRDLDIALRPSAALGRARLWPAAAAPADIKPAKMFAEHMRLNKDKGLGARIASAAVSIPGLMQKALDKDYKDNLY
ncbi:pyridoxamine 5'-phosphate oxidase family protein [Sphingopyxis sp. DBS4]|uniref:pyridoxamine 5'-phosphate oxidase family protein n=1 Tax=Sphingopyxis sp. DBS4 TaxID=2968500 RepID=UPI00214B7D8D|nr:pyridoxamine 5'-phosphate oxidase family protein [Sphingopyxis sp. DBS4]